MSTSQPTRPLLLRHPLLLLFALPFALPELRLRFPSPTASPFRDTNLSPRPRKERSIHHLRLFAQTLLAPHQVYQTPIDHRDSTPIPSFAIPNRQASTMAPDTGGPELDAGAIERRNRVQMVRKLEPSTFSQQHFHISLCLHYSTNHDYKQADLCSARRERISTDEIPGARHVSQQVLERSRRSNIPGTAEYEEARANQSVLNAWNSKFFASSLPLEQLMKYPSFLDMKNDVSMEELADLGHGQSHRAGLNDALHLRDPKPRQLSVDKYKIHEPLVKNNDLKARPKSLDKYKIFEAPAANRPRTPQARQPRNHPVARSSSGRGGGVAGTRGRAAHPSPGLVSTLPRTWALLISTDRRLVVVNPRAEVVPHLWHHLVVVAVPRPRPR